MKIRGVIRLIEKDGWFLIAVKGSHRQFNHPVKKDRVTIAAHPGDELAKETLNSALKQAGLKEKKA